MYGCILALPLLSFLTTCLGGRFIGSGGASYLAPFAVLVALFFSLLAFFECSILTSSCFIHVSSWFTAELFACNWSFMFDGVTATMLLVISGVSSLVHVYSTEYMSNDPHRARFLGYLSLFTFFMLVLVTADNFLIMFFGWEGIGLASFLLISFWFNRIQAGKSAIKAMIVNRVGDVGLALAVALVFLTFKSVDYAIVFALTPCAELLGFEALGFEFSRLGLITFLLFFGAVGKSAQIGLHIWLPDAMEGPTPVSALIHAATLVTAGVFLIIRCCCLFESSPSTLVLVTTMGAITSFFAASVGLVQNDLKRVIAYSTCSQLGYMVFACGLSNYSLALFHLANHAVFKALLFLSVGCVIHGLCDEQDLRRFGGVVYIFPVTYVMILIGSLALTGFPFLTGFYSKDVILEIAVAKHTTVSKFAHTLGCLAAFCTSFYSFRLLFLTFLNKTNSYRVYLWNAHEAPVRMILPLLCLAFGSLFIGFLGRDLFIGFGSLVFLNNIVTTAENLILIDGEFISPLIKHIPLMLTVFGGLLSWLLTFRASKIFDSFPLKLSFFGRCFIVFLSKRWHFDQIVNTFVVFGCLSFGYHISFRLFDKGFIEAFGPVGLVKLFGALGYKISGTQTGFLFHGCFIILFSSICLLLAFALRLIGWFLYVPSFTILVLCYCVFENVRNGLV